MVLEQFHSNEAPILEHLGTSLLIRFLEMAQSLTVHYIDTGAETIRSV
jgi:hypothetical protein